MSSNVESTPTKVISLADTSPVTMATAAQGNVSPAGTVRFDSYASEVGLGDDSFVQMRDGVAVAAAPGASTC